MASSYTTELRKGFDAYKADLRNTLPHRHRRRPDTPDAREKRERRYRLPGSARAKFWARRNWFRLAPAVVFAAAGVAGVAAQVPWSDLGAERDAIHARLRALTDDTAPPPAPGVDWPSPEGATAALGAGAAAAAAWWALSNRDTLPRRLQRSPEKRRVPGTGPAALDALEQLGWRWQQLVVNQRMRRVVWQLQDQWREAMVRENLRGNKQPPWRVWAKPELKWAHYPELTDVTFDSMGNFIGKVKLPVGFDVGVLHKDEVKRVVTSYLRLPWPWGAPEDEYELGDALEDKTKFVLVRLRYKGLPDPAAIPCDLSPAPSSSSLKLCFTEDGWVLWDMEQDPHCSINGATGSAKGLAKKSLISQATQAGFLVLLIDGQGGSEDSVWDSLPNVWRHRIRNQPDTLYQDLCFVLAQLLEVVRIVDIRAELCERYKVDRWADLPWEDPETGEPVLAAHPRILVVLDEPSILLWKARKDEEDEHIKNARIRIGRILNNVLRGLRKYGVNCLKVDQITYADTWMGPSVHAQIGRWVFLGNAPDHFQRMVGATSGWPKVPEQVGCGLVGRYGVPDPRHCRVPLFYRSWAEKSVRAQLAEWRELRPDLKQLVDPAG